MEDDPLLSGEENTFDEEGNICKYDFAQPERILNSNIDENEKSFPESVKFIIGNEFCER